MTSLLELWLPILVSAVFVFIASSIIHTALPWHKSDYPKIPNEDKVMDVLRPLAIPPGDYMVPRCANQKDFKSPEFQEKLKKGPAMVVTVLPANAFSLGRSFGFGFLLFVVVSILSPNVP